MELYNFTHIKSEFIYRRTLKRLEDIENLDEDTKSKLFFVIDTFLRDAKARQTYAI